MTHSHGHNHQAFEEIEPSDSRYQVIRRVTLIGSVLDTVLAVIKVVVGYMANSQALIADGIHSFSDLVTDVMVIVAAKHGSQDADEKHPYGHGRFETIATVILGITLIGVAFGIAWEAFDRLLHPEEQVVPGALAIIVALVSVFSKEWIYRYTMRVAVKIHSDMLKANAWHSRTDAISSIIVVVGLGGTMAGLPYLDAIAAIGVGMMIAMIGWQLAMKSVHELVDSALDVERVKVIREMILEIDGVNRVHELRTRKMGGEVLMDLHLEVGSHLSVSEGHYLSECVRKRVEKEFDEVLDVLVHIDPENDEKDKPSSELPTRNEVEQRLYEVWGDEGIREQIERITLHYLSGSIEVELLLKPDAMDTISTKQELIDKTEAIEWVESLNIHLEAP
ncbi:MAG: cation diffusion facilitator family transporter [Chromatiales bacterium]|nr:cation diffusion facilitator family transporter [Chromatiales bacterium]